jgi:hypothetical protein
VVVAGVAASSAATGTAGAQLMGGGDSLQIAGIAYLANAADVERTFPTAVALMRQADASGRPLSARLLTALGRAGVPVTAGLGKRTGSALAFAFDDEYQVVERVGDGGYRVITVLSAQLLTIDFTEEAVVASLPVIIEGVSRTDRAPGEGFAETAAATLSVLFDESRPGNVFTVVADDFRALPIGQAVCRTRVGRIEVDTGTVSVTSVRFGSDTAKLTTALRTMVARYWGPAARQPLLPNGNSQVRNQMLTRFANGDVFNLRIPEPDFEIHLLDVRTRRSVAGSNASRRIDATGIQAAYVVIEPGSGTRVAGGTFRTITYDTLPAAQVPTDLWPYFAHTVKTLTAGVASAARAGDARWFTQNNLDSPSSLSLSTWLKRCTSQ